LDFAMVSPVVLIALDACDPDLVQAWAEAGELPALAALLRSGARARVENPFGLFVGALWVSFAASAGVDRTRFHCWDEVELSTYRWRPVAPKPELYEPFWNRIAAAGRKVAAIDVPHARAQAGAAATELFEYGCHDRHWGLHSAPPELAREVAARFGLHPVLGLDGWRERHFAPDDVYERKGPYRTAEEEGRLTEALCEGAARKGTILRSLLAEEDWDLFVAVFGESHAAGHQLWHLHDQRHRRFDPAGRAAAGGDPLLRVYRALDEEVGRLLASLPEEATAFVLLSHGMAAHHDGTHLLDEVLLRLDRGAAPRRREALKPALPPLRHLAERLGVPVALRSALGQRLRGDGAAARARRRFFAEPNNSVHGGIRFNLIGREPLGRVAAEEVDGLVRWLEAELRALVNVETGGPVVLGLHRCDAHHRRAEGDTMPDLFVEWARDAPIEAVESPSIGTLHTPYTHWRTGDHNPDGLLLARGPGLAPGAERPALKVEDIGPSLAARLGVALDGCEGRAVPWLSAPQRVGEPGRSI
jgi:predicted AlkP superfamily phosphohydrolase/phosphomutase